MQIPDTIQNHFVTNREMLVTSKRRGEMEKYILQLSSRGN
jgi:hypothetical protein